MTKQNRVKKILETLVTNGKVNIKVLSTSLSTSEATIRRDLDYLADSYNEIERTFGGAIYNKGSINSEVELLFDIKMNIDKQNKIKIAKIAKNLVEEGDTILIDSGSTCYYFANELLLFNKLTVICTDLKIAELLANHSGITVFIVGGEVRNSIFSIGSHFAEDFLKNFTLSKAFMSCDSIDPISGQIANSNIFEVGLKKEILNNSEKIYLLIDSQKFLKQSTYAIGNVREVTNIITDYTSKEGDFIELRHKTTSV